MSTLAELKCALLDSNLKANLPKESSPLPGELQICELLLKAEYLTYNDGFYLTNLGMLENENHMVTIELIEEQPVSNGMP